MTKLREAVDVNATTKGFKQPLHKDSIVRSRPRIPRYHKSLASCIPWTISHVFMEENDGTLGVQSLPVKKHEWKHLGRHVH